MYRSATLSSILEQMTFVKNAVDETRRKTYMKSIKANKGAGFVDLGDGHTEKHASMCKFIGVFK